MVRVLKCVRALLGDRVGGWEGGRVGGWECVKVLSVVRVLGCRGVQGVFGWRVTNFER